MTRRLIPVLREMPANVVLHGYPTASLHAATTQAECYKHKDGTLVAVAECCKRDDGVPLYCAVRYEVRDTCDKLTVRADDHNDRKAKEYEGL